MSRRNAVFPAGRRSLYDRHRYSAAIASDDLLFVSGQVGVRADGSPEPDFGAQVRTAFFNLEATLVAGGFSGQAVPSGARRKKRCRENPWYCTCLPQWPTSGGRPSHQPACPRQRGRLKG